MIQDSTFIILGVILCLTTVICFILYIYSKQKQNDKNYKMPSYVSGIIITAIVAIVFLIAEQTGSIEKGWTEEHLYVFLAIYLGWIILHVIKWYITKVKPYEVRREAAFKILADEWSAREITKEKPKTTDITCPMHNKTIVPSEDGQLQVVDAFLFNIYLHTKRQAIIVIDAVTLDNELFILDPSIKIIEEKLYLDTVSAKNIHKDDEDSDKTQVKDE